MQPWLWWGLSSCPFRFCMELEKKEQVNNWINVHPSYCIIIFEDCSDEEVFVGFVFFYGYQLWNLAWKWSYVLHERLWCDDDLLSTFPYESHLVNSLWFVNLQAAYWIEMMDCVAEGTDFCLPVGLISNDSFVVSVGGWEASSPEFSVFFCFSLNLELGFSDSCCSILCCSQCSVSAKHFLLAVNKHMSVCPHLSSKCWKTSACKNETNTV